MKLKEIKIAGYLISIKKDGNMLGNQSRIGEYSHFEQKIVLAEGLQLLPLAILVSSFRDIVVI